MDVRLSPEQQALRDSVAQVVDRLGPQAVGQLDDVERAAKLDAAVDAAGWRELRTPDDTGAPWASAVEAAIVAEELGRGLADAAVHRTDAGGRAPAAGRAARHAAETGRARDQTSAALAVAVDDGDGDRRHGRDVGARARRRSTASPAAVAGRAHVPSTSRGRSGRRRAPGRHGRRRPLTDDDLTRWTALGLALTCADLVGTMRGAVQLACDYAAARRQYGVADRIVPGGAAPAGRRARGDGGLAQRRAARGVGGRRARAGRRAGRRRAWPRRTAPAPRARCARPRSRCTAASATRGSAWPTSTSGGRCCRPTCSAASARTSHECSLTTALEVSMDFGDSPAEAEFRRGCARGSRPTTPACRRRRPTTTTGPGRRRGTSRSTTPGSSACRGRRRSAATSCRACTT